MEKHNTLAEQFLDPEGVKIKFRKAVRAFLKKWDNWPDSDTARMDWKRGASMSYCKQTLRDDGWVNLGGSADFERLLEDNGFELVPARLKSGKNHKSIRIVKESV